MQWDPDDGTEHEAAAPPTGVSTSQPAGAGLAVRPYSSHHDIAAADRERQMLWKARWRSAQRGGARRLPSGRSGSADSQEVLACLPELRLAPSLRTDTYGTHARDSRSGGDAVGASPQRGSSGGDGGRDMFDSGGTRVRSLCRAR